MSFMRLRNGDLVDGDREGVRRFLDARHLWIDGRHGRSDHLRCDDGSQFEFDGYWTDLHLNPLNSSETFSGGIWHATLSVQECDFIFDLCNAGGFLICNHQGSPMFVVPVGTHTEQDLREIGDELEVAYVDSAEQMRQALSGSWQQFVTYRDQVIRPRHSDQDN